MHRNTAVYTVDANLLLSYITCYVISKISWFCKGPGNFFPSLAIRIGFALPLYRFQEPANESLTTEVTLVKEGNRESEQTFGVVVTVSDPGGILQAASIQASNESIYDYRLFIPSTFILLLFPSAVQSVTFSFFINADELPEGTEAFRASSTPFEGFATFQAPITDSAHQTTTIEILDNDCELLDIINLFFITLNFSQYCWIWIWWILCQRNWWCCTSLCPGV